MTAKLSDNNRLVSIEENLKRINFKIEETAIKAGRSPKDIKLMAVTKTVEPEHINHAINCGVSLIGENKVQEFISKKNNLNLDFCSAHLIGHLQTNKVKKIVGEVSMIQSVDSIKLAREISKHSLALNIKTQILVEINIGREESKTGILPETAEEFIEEISLLEGIEVKGLMSIPPNTDEISRKRMFFSGINKLFVDIKGKKMDNIYMDILSVGMTDDFCEAIMEGSTMIRIGSGIFGARIYR